MLYARTNDLPRAVASWNRAVEIDPRQYDALFNIGLVEGRAGHTAEARAALMRFVKTAPKERYSADIATARQALTSLRQRTITLLPLRLQSRPEEWSAPRR